MLFLSRMLIHIDAAHENPKHQCEFCGDEFGAESDLKDHVEEVHGALQRFKNLTTTLTH